MRDARERQRGAGLFARLLARRGSWLAAIGLWLLTGFAALAPFVASDRPWFVRAVDRGEVEAALRTLVPLARSHDRIARIDDAQFLRERLAASSQTRAEALERERDAVALRARILARSLDESAPSLTVLEASIAAGIGLEGPALAAEAALRIGADGKTATGGTLLPRASWPLFAALDGTSVLVLAAWIALGVLLARARHGIDPGPRSLLTAAAAVIVVTGTWLLARPADPHLDARGWKERLASPVVSVERVVFPPIAMGYAETNTSEAWRPPTWLASSTIDSEGRYVSGARASPAGGAGATLPAHAPVLVRPGEPERNSPWRHLLGTDGSGRDVLARLLHGARASLAVGFGAALLLAVIGTLVGLVAGTLRGAVDLVLSRILEVVLCFPAFFLVLTFVAVADPRVVPPALSVALVIGGVGWTGVARLVRVRCLELSEAEFVLAARAQGLSSTRILLAHVLPNAAAPALVALSFAVGTAILTESALSFLGLGVQVPVPSWGALASESRNVEHAWILVFPGLCVFATALCTNVLGEGLRDALDPRAPLATGEPDVPHEPHEQVRP